MSNDRILELMTRKLSGEATPEELAELQGQVSADPEALETCKAFEQFWSRRCDPTHLSVEENLQKVLKGLGLTDPAIAPANAALHLGFFHRFRSRAAIAAAVLTITAGLALVLARQTATTAPPMASLLEKHNAKGTRSIIQLTDGSKIWLNADSKLKYPEIFKGATRDIYLNGEAFFEVAKNADHPFVIHLANGTVRVLGTSFNIRAYDNEAVVETSVATGKIAFIPKYRSPHNKQDTVYLAPDHKARYTYEREELSTITTSGQEDKAWTEGKLIFRSTTMEQIAIELERNFGKKVLFVDDAPKTFIFTGSFENNSLDEIMYYLARTKNFKYKITNSELLIAVTADQLR